MSASKQNHCKRGHSLAGAAVRPNGNRECAQCKRDREFARYHGIPVQRAARMQWGPHSISVLVRMFPDHTSTEIAKAIGCSGDSVKKKGIGMGLKKSASFLLKYPQTENLRAESEPKQRISHPKPGVTIHRIM